MHIHRIAIVGMGALGILYGDHFVRHMGKECVRFVLNENRIATYRKQGIFCNGAPCDFLVADEKEPAEPADLLIMAVKGTALMAGIASAKNQVGPNTTIISVLNGISSESFLAQAFGQEKIIYCVAQGMDAVKSGNHLTYHNLGELCIGIPADEACKKQRLSDLAALLTSVNLPHRVEVDIRRRLWSKFMLNVGVNQVVMVEQGTYGTIQHPGRERQQMIAAMEEVLRLAPYEGVTLTADDLKEDLALVDRLSPEGMPSMRQDGLAKRPSEVELFSGTVLRLAEKHGLETPVNRELYQKICEMERGYG